MCELQYTIIKKQDARHDPIRAAAAHWRRRWIESNLPCVFAKLVAAPRLQKVFTVVLLLECGYESTTVPCVL